MFPCDLVAPCLKPMPVPAHTLNTPAFRSTLHAMLSFADLELR